MTSLPTMLAAADLAAILGMAYYQNEQNKKFEERMAKLEGAVLEAQTKQQAAERKAHEAVESVKRLRQELDEKNKTAITRQEINEIQDRLEGVESMSLSQSLPEPVQQPVQRVSVNQGPGQRTVNNSNNRQINRPMGNNMTMPMGMNPYQQRTNVQPTYSNQPNYNNQPPYQARPQKVEEVVDQIDEELLSPAGLNG